MTTHAPSPLDRGIAVCGQRRSKFGATVTCVKCLEAMRRLLAAQKRKEAPYALPAAVPSAADVNGGNDAITLDGSGVVTRAAASKLASSGVVFGAAAASIPGTVVRRWPHEYAFRYVHWLANGQFVITKYASPEMPAFM